MSLKKAFFPERIEVAKEVAKIGERLDKKPLRAVWGNAADFTRLTKTCVASANSVGGRLWLGIEDGDELPPFDQKIPDDLCDTIRRRIDKLTVNVSVVPTIQHASNGGQYVELQVLQSTSVAFTTDGRYFLWAADRRKRVTGDDIVGFSAEIEACRWESQTSLRIARSDTDPAKLKSLITDLLTSDRVKPSLKEGGTDELLDYYRLADGEFLTHLGILYIGKQDACGQLSASPVIRYVKYDERGEAVYKLVWDDHRLSPMELIDAVWAQVPDFRESYEIPDGMYFKSIPAFDESVVRELLVNALVHRPYTQSGDIFLALHPDRLEIVNPGLLPLGVTSQNVLHMKVCRNENFARLFFDLKLMEGNGTGFDRMYEALLSQGRAAPQLIEGHDRIKVIIQRRILKREVIRFIAIADAQRQLNRQERIALAMLAQQDAMTSRELVRGLALTSSNALPPWIGRLEEMGLIGRSGERASSMLYFVGAGPMRDLQFTERTTLRSIEPHRLIALILEDIRRYPNSKIGEIHKRIGVEIPRSRLRCGIDQLAEVGQVIPDGQEKGTRYRLP